MNTSVKNLTSLNRLQAVLKANQAAAKLAVEAQPETTPLAEFNEQAGVKPHHSKSHKHASLAHRSRLLSNLRGLSKAAPNTEKRADMSDDDLFGSEMSLLLDVLHGGGEEALEEWMSKRHDPLERHELLEHAVENSSNEDKAALSQALSKLKSEHGEVIASALKDANALRSAVHQMDTLSQAAGSARAHGAYAIFDFSDSKKPVGPSSPLDLANRLMDKFGAEHFGEALKKTRSELGSQMRQAQGAELGPRMWLSMSSAASFNAIQSTFAIGVNLRVSLSEANIEPQAKEGETVCTLLSLTAGGGEEAEELANRLAGRDGLSPKQQANMFRLIAQAVDALPLTLWQEARRDVRMNLIAELKTLGGAFSSQAQQTKESADVTLERRLRQELALKSARTVGEQ